MTHRRPASLLGGTLRKPSIYGLAKIAAALGFIALCPLMMAPSGGIPASPTFRTVNAKAAVGSSAFFDALGGAGGAHWQVCASDSTNICEGGSGVGGDVYMQASTAFHIASLAGNDWITLSGNGTTINVPSAVSQAPFVSFDVNLVTGPTFVGCRHCQGSPTVTKNSVGNFSITAVAAGNYFWSCTVRNNAAAPGTLSIISVTTGGLNLNAYNTSNVLADPGTVECVGVSGQ